MVRLTLKVIWASKVDSARHQYLSLGATAAGMQKMLKELDNRRERRLVSGSEVKEKGVLRYHVFARNTDTGALEIG